MMIRMHRPVKVVHSRSDPLWSIPFKEDVLRVKRSRFRSVIPSLRSRASSERSEGSLFGERSFAALRMTKRDGLFFEMDWGLCMTLRYTLYWFMLMDERKRIDRMRCTCVYRKDFIYDR